jgi:hypothetical protein
MDRTYESAATLVGRATGPLVSHLVTFVASLIDQQFTASIIYIKVQHALAFDRWLAERGVVLADLGEVHIERYQHRSRLRHQRICTETWDNTDYVPAAYRFTLITNRIAARRDIVRRGT